MPTTLMPTNQPEISINNSWSEPQSVLLADDELDALIDAQVAVFWNGPNGNLGPIATPPQNPR